MYILMQPPWTFQTMLGSHRTLLCRPWGLSIRTKLAVNPGIPLVVLETLPSLLSYRCSLMRSQGPTSSPTYTLASGRHFVNPNQFIERVCITEGIRIIHTLLHRFKDNQSVWFKPYSLFYSVLCYKTFFGLVVCFWLVAGLFMSELHFFRSRTTFPRSTAGGRSIQSSLPSVPYCILCTL